MWSARYVVPILLASLLLAPAAPAAQTLDTYGGYADLSADGGATGYFRAAKLGARWVFVTPEGHAYWLRGVFNVDPSGSVDDLGDSYANRILRKYGSTQTWALQAARRLRAWGFNAVAEYAYAGLAELPPAERLPYNFMDRPSWYGLQNQGGYAPGPFKDLIECLEGSVYTGYTGGRLPDLYDPNYPAYSDGRMQAGVTDPQWGPILTSPWSLGVTMDDADDLFGFGPGPEVAAPVTHPHVGWIALVVTPTRAASAKHGVTYADPTVYTKLALRDFLRARYAGTLAALNAAWGASYTSWDSDGGYGLGAGLRDENGRHPWLGSAEGTLAGAAPGAVADLDAFLYEYARRYFTIRAASIRRALPNHLVFGPSTLNGWGGLTRAPILRAAGEAVDVLQVGVSNQRVLDLTATYAGDRPIVTWEGWPANPDSALWRYPNPYGAPPLTTQGERGQRYEAQVQALLGMTTPQGTQPIAGFKWWAWADSWAEKTNWGLVSFLDNAYDGAEARVAPGTDPWGYPTGGEEHDYGDFLSWVGATDQEVRGALNITSPPTIDTSPPTVAIVDPTDGSVVPHRSSVTVVASASDDVAVVAVEVFINGQLLCSLSDAPFTCTWNVPGGRQRTYGIHALARDAAGNTATSDVVTVTSGRPSATR